jgi:type III secretion protein V
VAHPDTAGTLLADAKRWGLNTDRVQPALDRLYEDGMSGSGSAGHNSERRVDAAALFEEAVAGVVPQIGVRINAEDYERTADSIYPGGLKLMQDGLFWEMGLYLRPATVSPDSALAPGEYQLFFNDVVLPPARGLERGTLLINTSAESARLMGLDARPAVNPANGSEAAIVSRDREGELRANPALTVWDPAGYVVLAMSATVLAHAGAFINARLTDLYLIQFRRVFPYLADAIDERIDRLTLTRTLRLLLDESISIRDLRTIADAVLSVSGISTVDNTANIVFQLDTSVAYPASAMANPERMEAADFAECARMRLKRYISHKYTRGQSTLVVYLVEPAIERRFADTRGSLPEHEARGFVAAVRETIGNAAGLRPFPVILTGVDVRRHIRRAIETEFPNVAVLSYQELVPEMNIQPLARIALP